MVRVNVEVSIQYASLKAPVTIIVYVPASRLLDVETYIVYELIQMKEGNVEYPTTDIV
jgi:hypothetical protein